MESSLGWLGLAIQRKRRHPMRQPLPSSVERVHWAGISFLTLMVALVVLIRGYPETMWTRMVPLLDRPPIEKQYSLEDMQHWAEAQATLPTRQVKLQGLREEIAAQITSLNRWIIEQPSSPVSRKQQLRSMAESLHEQATQFGLEVSLIRIENQEPTTDTDSIQWCPMTVRFEGDHLSTCQFLHHLASHRPNECRRLRWSATPAETDDEGRPRFELEMELAFAIAAEGDFPKQQSIDEAPQRTPDQSIVMVQAS